MLWIDRMARLGGQRGNACEDHVCGLSGGCVLVG